MIMSEDNKKSGYVAIIGRPNVGKSTLMNRIIGQKIAIISDRAQTTRNRIRTVYTDERGQMVFLDTPGINSPKNRLGEYMLDVALDSAGDADVILWLVEPSNFIGKGEEYIMEQLGKMDVPVILVMNKIDEVPKEEVYGYIDHYKARMEFAQEVPISAEKGTNVQALKEEIFKALPEGPYFYDEEELTDQSLRQIAAEMVREKALRLLKDEVPHGIAVVIDKYHERKNRTGEPIADIDAVIICERDSHKGIVIGKGGSMLKKIGSAARRDIEEMTEMKVNLKLWVKVRKEWRDNEKELKNFGYE